MAIPQQSIQELVGKQPFRPFRIVTASGKEYPVEDPRLVVVMRSEIFYAFPKRDRWTTIPISHITSIDVGEAV
jgi:hypothetical protein